LVAFTVRDSPWDAKISAIGCVVDNNASAGIVERRSMVQNCLRWETI
jgi:hypothetical protein